MIRLAVGVAVVLGACSKNASPTREPAPATPAAPAAPVSGDPCPVDFDVAHADAWPGCFEGGPLGLERTYFMLASKPCRIAHLLGGTEREPFELRWGDGGRLERQTFADHVTTYHYDASGRLATADDVDGAEHRTITYQRDAQGRLVKVDDGRAVTTYTRDPSGAITAIDERGSVERHETIRYEAGVAVAAEAVSVYDGRKLTTTSTVERDAQGRRTRAQHVTTDPEGEQVTNDIRFAYDADGRLASLTWISDGGLHDETVIAATYDGSGRLATLDEGAWSMRFAYDCE